jgi:hypothetical protein
MTCGQGPWGAPLEITKGGGTAFLPVRHGFKLGQHPAFGQWLMAINDIPGHTDATRKHAAE